MRRSSAPSFSTNSKRGRFSTPFIVASSERASSHHESNANAVATTVPPRTPLPIETSRQEVQRRPLAEVLSLLEEPSAETESTPNLPTRVSGSSPGPRFATGVNQQRTVETSGSAEQASVIKDSDAGNISITEDPERDVRYFDVIWCKKSARKHKKWEGDAIMQVHRRHVILMCPKGTVIGQASGYKVKDLQQLDDGALLPVGGREVQIQNAVKTADWLSRAASASAADEVEKEPPPAFKSASLARRFVSPLAGAAARCPGGGPAQPRFDPRTPNALVLPRPPAEYQWRHNVDGRSVVEVVVDPHLSRHLRPHQRAGVTFLYQCVLGLASELGYGAVLADQMGLGKTLQCIALLWTLLKQGPFGGEPVIRRALIVTPSSLVNNWIKEFNKWLGRERLAVFAVDQSHSAQEYASGRVSPVLVISYEMAVRSLNILQQCNFDLMVCDEGHRLKNGQIKTTMALSSLDCRRRVLLTGTPVQNNLLEFFALVEFVNPGALGSSAEFRRDFERPVVDGRQPGASDEVRRLGEERAEALATVTDRFILRRTAEVLEKYLPPKVEMVVFCRPTPLQVDLYRQALSSAALRRLFSKESSTASGGHHLVHIGLLKKLCSHPALLLTADQDECSLLSSLGLQFPDGFSTRSPSATDSGKMAVLWHLLSVLRRAEHSSKIVLISYYTRTLDLLAELCEQHQLTCLRLDGRTPSDKRQSIVDQFNSSYATETVFLLSAKAGGVGLNLVGASSIVLFDLDWNPANDLQALSRVWRDGQKNTTRVYRLLTTGTIEEKIYQRQISKQGLSAAVVDAAQKTAAHFSWDELRELFTLDDETDCSTHDLLDCQCDTIGGPCPMPAPDDLVQRSCQLGAAATAPRQRGGMEQLCVWQHYRGPLDPDLVQDDGLAEAGDQVSFLFRHVVSAAFE